MTQPTIAQLHNLTDRAAHGLTADEQQRLRDGINQLEALQAVARGYCPGCGRGDAAPTVEHWEQERQSANFWLDQHQRARQSAFDQRQRAKRAEAVVARVRAARNRIAHASNVDAIWCLDQLDAALAEPGPVATQAAEPATSPLRDLIAAAIYERNNPAHRWADAHPDDLLAYGFDADAVLAVILPATRITATLARMSDADVQRVIALYERWVKAGPPPLGTSINRWWDKRLVELNAALNPKGN